jgi:hypothetical protein
MLITTINMNKTILLTSLLVISLHSSAQVNELEKFRKETTAFLNYDNGKIDAIPKNPSNTARLKVNLEKAFLDFVLNKNSKDLEDLKKNSIYNKSDYIIGNNNYYFTNERRDIYKKALENNVNYCITFYGLYDYRLSNFVSFYIQPFNVDAKEFVVYYYKLNGTGTYYIKDVATNSIVFKSEALTSDAAILKFSKLDQTHSLLVEDMGDNGQRALVVNTASKTWTIAKAFKGNAFENNSTDYSKMSNKGSRSYLIFAANKNIKTHYGFNFLKKYEIQFDEATKTISYKQYSKNEKDIKMIQAKWQSGSFTIDDYYIGKDVLTEDLPVPG